MPHKLFIFHGTDYIDYPLGGTLGTIKNFLNYTEFKCNLIGITKDPKKKLGVWTTVSINNKVYDFLPIARVKKEIIPHKIQMLLGTFLYWSKIKPKFREPYINLMLFINREIFLAVKILTLNKRKLNVFYKMTEAVNPITISDRRISKIKIFQKIYYNVFIKTLLNNASVIFAINKQCREFCEKILTTEEKQKSIVDVHHYVDYDKLLNLFESAHFSNNNEEIKLIFWGRIAQVKGLELVIGSVKHLEKNNVQVSLDLIGNGPELTALKKLVHDLKLEDNVRFLGQKNITEIASLSRNADLFVMSSHSEGIPTSMLEALTFGLRVVSTPVGGIPTMVTEGQNAYLVENREDKLFAESILKAIKLDKNIACQIGRSHIKNNFSAESVVKNMDMFMNNSINNDTL